MGHSQEKQVKSSGPVLVLGAEGAPVCTLNLALVQHFEEHQLLRTIPAVVCAALSRAVGRAALFSSWTWNSSFRMLDLQAKTSVMDVFFMPESVEIPQMGKGSTQ